MQVDLFLRISYYCQRYTIQDNTLMNCEIQVYCLQLSAI